MDGWGNPDGRGNPDDRGNPDGFFADFHRPDYPNTNVFLHRFDTKNSILKTYIITPEMNLFN